MLPDPRTGNPAKSRRYLSACRLNGRSSTRTARPGGGSTTHPLKQNTQRERGRLETVPEQNSNTALPVAGSRHARQDARSLTTS